MTKRPLVFLVALSPFLALAWPNLVSAECLGPCGAPYGTYTCDTNSDDDFTDYCGDDPMNCPSSDCDPPVDCDSCCNGADCAEDCVPEPECDPCLTDPCADGCPDAGPCCLLSGNEKYCCEHPEDIEFCNETCGGVVKPPEGNYDCCRPGGSGPNGQPAWCHLEGSRMCRDRNICNEGGGCAIGGDTVCAVSIVHSCNDNDDCGCTGPDCGGGNGTSCPYTFSYNGTAGCDGVVRPEGGGTVSFTVNVASGSCPDSSAVQGIADIHIANALANAGHPPDSDGDGICDCATGTDVCTCSGELVFDPETGDCACPVGQVPGPEADQCCDPVTETCDQIDLCPNIAGMQTSVPAGMVIDGGMCVCGQGYRQCGQECIPDTGCCSGQYLCNGQCIPDGTCCAGTCPSGGFCCQSNNTCVADAAQCVDTCLGYADVSEYCTEVVSEAGTVNEPWATRYAGNSTGLAAFFARQNPTAANLDPQTFAEATAARAAVCDDGNPATPCDPVFGRVYQTSAGTSCQANVCDYGQECALYVRSSGRTSAVCVDSSCDVCDQTLPACDPSNPPAEGECCYDAAQCECDPAVDLSCCEADPNKPGYNPSCVLTPRGVIIEALPNVVGVGDSCIVLWASQGMRAVTLEGDGFGLGQEHSTLRNLLAGVVEIENVQTSSQYKIVGQGADGKTYEATDLCAVAPDVNEF